MLRLSSSEEANTGNGGGLRGHGEDAARGLYYGDQDELIEADEQDSINDEEEDSDKKDEKDIEYIEPSNRIIGGVQSAYGRYKYFAIIHTGNYNCHAYGCTECGGTVVHDDFVLTAAHCLKPYMDVHVGAYRYNEKGESPPVVAKFVHPSYDRSAMSHDFLLLKLGAKLSNKIPRVKLGSTNSKNRNKLKALGLGMTEHGRLAATLREVTVKEISNAECNARWRYNGFIKNEMMCAGDYRKDSCQGDSGGPLCIPGDDPAGRDDVQVALVSFGKGCGDQNFPGVYARVAYAKKWIDEIICKHSNYKPTRCNPAVKAKPTCNDKQGYFIDWRSSRWLSCYYLSGQSTNTKNYFCRQSHVKNFCLNTCNNC